MIHVDVVLLTTDVLYIGLVLGLFVLIWHARGRDHLREPWMATFRQPVAAAAAVIIALFMLIALLDSLHFRRALPADSNGVTQYAPQVESVLDLVLRPLAESTERSYSAPLAAYALSAESVEMPDGSTRRERPRLHHGGAHLTDPARDRTADIARKALLGALAGGLTGIALVALFSLLMRKRGHATGFSRAAKAAAFTFVFIATLSGAGTMLCSGYHLLGTDKVGNDVLLLSLKSVRTGILIGSITTLVLFPVAIVLGVLAGFYRKWVDDLIQYIYTTLNAIPGVLLIAAAILSLQVYATNHPEWAQTTVERADLRLLFLCLVLGLTSWTGLCRLLRGETLKLRELEFVQAARVLGESNFSILRQHVVPNLMHIVLITVVLDFSSLVLAEAVLSYVGVGVDPTMHSWGNMINSARLELAREPVVWWPLFSAFTLMFMLVLSVNLFADAVRDAFDPRTMRS
jgi:peptide/nickel transport system permease protein